MITPSNIRVRFYNEAVKNEQLSKTEGRAIFNDLELVEIIVPGDRQTRFVGLANEEVDSKGTGTYANLYPTEYAAFKKGEARAASGTPLEHWAVLVSSQVAELKAAGILSVDELAVISDTSASRLGPNGKDLREQAQAFLASAKDGAVVSAQAAEIAELKAQMARLMELQAAPASAAATVEADTVSLADATDAQLKQFIKDQTGEAPRGNISREELERRVSVLADPVEEAA